MDSNVPMTIVCSKAVEDIKNILLEVMDEHNMSADLMVMILRDVGSHFERMRANDYSEAIIRHSAIIEELKKENAALKQASQLFNMEGQDDNAIDKS